MDSHANSCTQIDDCEKAISLDRGYVKAHIRCGRAYMKAGQVSKAKNHFAIAVKEAENKSALLASAQEQLSITEDYMVRTDD